MKRIISLFGFILISAISARAQNTTYHWVGGAPGFSGTIILDSPSSQAGSLKDIISISLFTPRFGSLSLDPNTISLTDPQFTWNSTGITEMFIAGLSSSPFIQAAVIENSGGGNALSAIDFLHQQPSIDTSGSWQGTPLPDVENSACLFGFSLACVAFFRRFIPGLVNNKSK